MTIVYYFLHCETFLFCLHVIKLDFEPSMKYLLHHFKFLCEHLSAFLYVNIINEQQKTLLLFATYI